MRIEARDKSIAILLPAAGRGTRMGSPNSKEVLVNPQYNIPYIQFAIESVSDLDCQIMIITRKEKSALVDWANSYQKLNSKSNVKLFFIDRSDEWPDSILKAKPVWLEKNIVLLPDTDWQPQKQVLKIADRLSEFDAVYGVFSTEKLNWGFVRITNEGFELVEKPKQSTPEFMAWGQIGFKREVGEKIFSAHLESTIDHQIKAISVRSSLLYLDSFFDRTRGE